MNVKVYIYRKKSLHELLKFEAASTAFELKFEFLHMSSNSICGFSIIGGTGRNDISMQFASRDFRPCWICTWVAVKLPLEILFKKCFNPQFVIEAFDQICFVLAFDNPVFSNIGSFEIDMYVDRYPPPFPEKSPPRLRTCIKFQAFYILKLLCGPLMYVLSMILQNSCGVIGDIMLNV